MQRIIASVSSLINRPNTKFLPERSKFEETLKISIKPTDVSFEGTVLLEAIYDNPNHWLRIALLFAALGIEWSKTSAIVGGKREKLQTKTLRNFGVAETIPLGHLNRRNPNWRKNIGIAKTLISKVNTQKDILELALPFKMPAVFLYDAIIREQRSPIVEISDKKLVNIIAEFLCHVDLAYQEIRRVKPQLIVCEGIGFLFPLLWIGLDQGLPVVVPYGEHGNCRFWRIQNKREVFDFMDRMKNCEIQLLDPVQQLKLEKIGEKAIQRRLNGEAIDISVRYAYQNKKQHIERSVICEFFNWDPNKDIVVIYMATLFDFPHFVGMSCFENYLDFIQSIVSTIRFNNTQNWLLKPHPMDEWYGGTSLEDVVEVNLYNHVKFVPTKWDSVALMHAVDRFVTYHGTIGIEATSMGKPVLVPEEGWYGDHGFVRMAESRDHFLQLLTENWWQEMDIVQNASKAKQFAGAFWGRPNWQKTFVLSDDPDQWEIYKSAPILIKNNLTEIERELSMIRAWYSSHYTHYHCYKMSRASNYIID